MKDNNTYYLRTMTAMLSSKWTLQVLYVLRDDTKRYSEINHILSDMTQKMLTNTVHKLERDGFIARTVYPTVPPKVEYQLTELGESLLSAITLLLDWTKVHVHDMHTAQKTYDTRKIAELVF